MVTKSIKWQKNTFRKETRIKSLFIEMGYLKFCIGSIQSGKGSKGLKRDFYNHLKHLDILETFCETDNYQDFIQGVQEIDVSEFLSGFLYFGLDEIFGENNYKLESELVKDGSFNPSEKIHISYKDENGKWCVYTEVFNFGMVY